MIKASDATKERVEQALLALEENTANFVKEFSINAFDPEKDFVKNFTGNAYDPTKDFVKDFIINVVEPPDGQPPSIERLSEYTVAQQNITAIAIHELQRALVQASEQSDAIAVKSLAVSVEANRLARWTMLAVGISTLFAGCSLLISLWVAFCR